MEPSMTTDALDSYQVAFREVFAPRNALDTQCTHLKDAAINDVHANNNCYERHNGTQKDCISRRRCTWKDTSPIFEGFMISYNFVRRHSSLGCTPAEAACIKMHGCDKWKTFIVNACRYA